MEKVSKEIEMSAKGKYKSFVMAGIFIIGSLMLGSMTGRIPLMLIVLGVFSLIMGFFTQNVKIFQFYDKHFVFQPSIVVKKHILYSNIISFNDERRKIIIEYNEEGKTKKVVLLKEVVRKDDLFTIKEILSKYL